MGAITTTGRSIQARVSIPVPHGARLIKADTLYTSTYTKNDTFTERLVFELRGHNCQILRYNQDNNGVMVYVDRRAEMMPLDCVEEYFERTAK